MYGATAPSPVADCELQPLNSTFEGLISHVARLCDARFRAICNLNFSNEIALTLFPRRDLRRDGDMRIVALRRSVHRGESSA